MNRRQAKKNKVHDYGIIYDWAASFTCELTWGQLKQIGVVPAPRRWRQRLKAKRMLLGSRKKHRL